MRRAILDEVFGEQNFCSYGHLAEDIFPPRTQAKELSANHDFILVYAKDPKPGRVIYSVRTEAQDQRYTNLDNDPRGLSVIE